MMLHKVGKSVLAAIVLVCIAAGAFAQVPTSKHVVLVINENTTYNDVIANMPWLTGQGNSNGYATNYRSDNGGSLLDYLWLASGSCHSKANCSLPAGTHDFNCSGNDCYYPGTAKTDPITDNNLFRELNNHGISWKVYAQSYAAAGGTPTTPDNHNGTSYYRRHNGATWYSDILNNTNGSAGRIVDLAKLTTDLNNGTLPRFMIIVPDGNHDAHDCPVGMSSCTTAQKLAATDAFLRDNLGPILETPDFQAGGDGLAIVTFDECGGGTNAGCGASIYTALIGPKIRPHTVSATLYKHENTLRTMLDALGIRRYPGAAALASDMSDFFTTSGIRPDVVVSDPANGSTMASPVPIQASAYASPGHSIAGWWIYVDSVGVHHAGAVASIHPSISMHTGTHTIVIRAWDSSGNFADQTLSLSVDAIKPSVAVSTPTNNSTVGSPANLRASATPSSGRNIAGWRVYVDSKATYSGGATDSISTDLKMSKGKHSVVVRAWDSSGNYGDHTLSVTAQ
ncbi:MAG TPA: alkaline phosphatase family protein [Candidatus Binatia bacterium]|nr:alkaline phosphatase family protein [Candidatus Binatia bacterium]